MTGRHYGSFLLRAVLTCLFCAIGYGLMQLPVLVAVRTHGLADAREDRSPAAVTEKRNAPPADMRQTETAAAGTPEHPADRAETTGAKAAASDPLIEALKTVIDPELGINIVDLGLIRKIDKRGSGQVTLTMIPTSPLCPYLKHLVAAMKKTVPERTPYQEVRVKIDMQQRWTPACLSPEGRAHFFGDRP